MDKISILRTPYDEPVTPFEPDAAGRSTHAVLTGRRPGMAATGIPGEDGVIPDLQTVEPHKTINLLRRTIKEWREGGYPGTTTGTRGLLEFWHRPSSRRHAAVLVPDGGIKTIIRL